MPASASSLPKHLGALAVILVLSLAFLSPLAVRATGTGNPTLIGKTLVSSPPTGDKGPDDITYLTTPSLDGGNPMIWTAYQNGIQANGTAGTPGGPTQSTIAGYDASTGTLVTSIQVTGKSDGLSADQITGKLISTLNEDSHSSMAVIDPATGTVTYYTYSPNPGVSGNGGTDSIAVIAGNLYLAHSNPNDVTQAATYLATLNDTTHVATLAPVFYDNSIATSISKGTTVKLGLTDPDTNFAMPENTPSYPGALAQISQADGEVIFSSPTLTGTPQLWQLNVTDNRPGNVPPIDGFAVAASNSGWLYVVDAKGNNIQAFDTSGWPTGTVFVGEPSDNSNPLVGTLNLQTGVITPFTNTFASPKGLLFVPSSIQPTTTTATVTNVVTQTSTAVSSFTSTAISTQISTQVSTQISTTTSVSTTTESNTGLDDALYGVIVVLAIVVIAIGYIAARRGR